MTLLARTLLSLFTPRVKSARVKAIVAQNYAHVVAQRMCHTWCIDSEASVHSGSLANIALA